MHCLSSRFRFFILLLISGWPVVSGAAITHYLSFGMPRDLLATHLVTVGKTADARAIFRGFPEHGTPKAFLQELLPLLKRIPAHERPRISIDPHPFDAHQVSHVPVIEKDGQRDSRSARFRVIEPDPRSGMRERIQNLSMASIKEMLIRSVPSGQALRMPRAQTPSQRTIHPDFRLPFDLEDPKGRTLIEGGAIRTPMDFPSPEKTWIILDQDDPKQMAWLESQDTSLPPGTPILLRGQTPGTLPSSLKGKSQIPTYGLPDTWTSRLRVETLPARITRRESYFEIATWPP